MGHTVLTRIRAGAAVVAGASVIATGVSVVAGGEASAAPKTDVGLSCGSANPLAWAPRFTWRINAGSGEALPPGGSKLVPALLLSGDNSLPNPPAGLLPSIGPNWYGTRVVIDWNNTTTKKSGRAVSDTNALVQKPSIPVNRAFTGKGRVNFTATIETGGAFWWLNTQRAVCRGSVDIVEWTGP